jgi:hypothetical protein
MSEMMSAIRIGLAWWALTVQDLEDAIQTGTAASAGKTAAELSRFAGAEVEFWRKAGVEPALKLAQQQREIIGRLRDRIDAGKVREASPELHELQVTCRTCHDLHAEKQIR